MLPKEIIDYARFHGLAVDHRAFNPLSDFLTSNIPEIDLEESPTSIPLPDDPALTAAFQEKITVDRDAIQAIASCIGPQDQVPETLYDDLKKLKRLRLSPPLLPTDHINDVYEFRAEARRRREAHFPLDSLPFDGDYKSDLLWSPQFVAQSEDLKKEAAREKLDSTREVLDYIRKTVCENYYEQAREEIVKNDLRYIKTSVQHRLSPPLLPLDEVSQPYIPSSPALELPLLSDITDPDAARLKELEQTIKSADRIDIDTASHIDTEKVRKLLDSVENPAPCDTSREAGLLAKEDRPKLNEAGKLKLEPFLSPPRIDPESAYPEIELSNLQELQKGEQQAYTNALNYNSFHDLLDDEHLGISARLALESIDKQTKEERISDLHLIPKLVVPIVKPVAFDIPWKNSVERHPSTENLYPHYLLAELLNQGQDGTTHGDSGDSELRWVPYYLPKRSVETHEAIMDTNNYLEKALKPPPGIVKSSELLWKPGSVRILGDYDDGEDSELDEEHGLAAEVSEGSNQKVHESPSNTSASVGRQLPDNIIVQGQRAVPAKRSILKSESELKTKKLRLVQQQKPQTHEEAVSDSICSFMQTRGLHSNNRNTATSELFRGSAPHPPEIQVSATPDPVTQRHFPHTVDQSLPSPPKPTFTRQYTLILHTSLLRNYTTLVNRLETHQLHPPRLIFRDPLNLKTPFPKAPEALPDIILSPTVGILIATMQSLTQRPLPGQQSSRPALRSRILSLKDTLECLFILMTSKSAASIIDSSISSALTELIALGSCLKPDFTLSVIIIPPMIPADSAVLPVLPDHTTQAPEHSNHLLNWILALIESHGYAAQPTQSAGTFLDEETIWEVWLREAGLNPYAAQAVVGIMKGSIGHETKDETLKSYGLRGFVQMGRAQRAKVFGPAIGKMVKKLNDLVDLQWNNNPALIDDGL